MFAAFSGRIRASHATVGAEDTTSIGREKESIMATILVPLDGSRLAERALPLASQLAHALGEQLRLERSYTFGANADLIPTLGIEDAARDYLQEQLEPLQRQEGIFASISAEYGPAASRILADAEAPDVAYIVMATHARAGFERALIGSVAEQVTRGARVPVFLMPAAAPPDRELAPIRQVAVALDGSALSEALIPPVLRLAGCLGASVTLMRAYAAPEEPLYDQQRRMISTIDQRFEHISALAADYLATLAERFSHGGVRPATMHTLSDHPGDGVLEMARTAAADLIVMATHGRSGLDRLRHGSITEQVLRHSTVPLLAFGQKALDGLFSAPAAEAVARA
jgi:nucleotide-binding universal stress UspA family protein